MVTLAGGSDRKELKEMWVGEAGSVPWSGAEDGGCACVGSLDCVPAVHTCPVKAGRKFKTPRWEKG